MTTAEFAEVPLRPYRQAEHRQPEQQPAGLGAEFGGRASALGDAQQQVSEFKQIITLPRQIAAAEQLPPTGGLPDNRAAERYRWWSSEPR